MNPLSPGGTRRRSRSEIEGAPTPRALTRMRPDLEPALLQLGPLPHRDQTEVACAVEAGLDGGDVHPDAVVADHSADTLRLEADHHLNHGSVRMLAGVAQRFLDDPEQGGLECPRKPRLLADDAELDVDGRALAEFLHELPQRRYQAEIVERHRAEVEYETAGVVEHVAHTVLEVGQLLHHHLWVPSDQPLQDLGLQHKVGHRLCRPVVHVARDAHALLFYDLKHLA